MEGKLFRQHRGTHRPLEEMPVVAWLPRRTITPDKDRLARPSVAAEKQEKGHALVGEKDKPRPIGF
jgi:hypothetical protein